MSEQVTLEYVEKVLTRAIKELREQPSELPFILGDLRSLALYVRAHLED